MTEPGFVPSRGFDDLEAFASWFLARKVSEIIPPPKPLLDLPTGPTFVLYRKGQYQVELIVVPKEYDFSSEHRHPNIDSIEVVLTYPGAQFTRNGKPVNDMLIRITHDDWHGGKVTGEGVAFLSIQKWLNGTTPTSVTMDWEGKVLCKEHGEMLGSKAESMS